MYIPHGEVGYLHAEAPELARKLVEGDGIFWSGDPNLTLKMGYLTARYSGFDKQVKRVVRVGEVLARRYEVWRHCDDGMDRMVGSWLPDEFDRILLDISGMRVDAPGRKTAADRIAKENTENEKRQQDEIAELRKPVADMAEFILRKESTEPETKFYGVGPEKPLDASK